MNNYFDNIIIEFRNKIKKIIYLYEEEKEKNKDLEKQKLTLEKKLERAQKEYQALEVRFNNLKMAKTITASAKDAHDAKLKVNSIVREIDKCIALLNR
ncbi:MAG: hypothetical protein MI922_12445 [Bacteroidales bacterium]|nr:hypothetical protein [Bacteroidales bacterium]